MKKFSSIVIISIIILASNLLGCNLINPLVFKVVRFPIILVLVILLLMRKNRIKRANMLFYKDICWLIFFPCFSWLSALAVWGQSPIGSLIADSKFYILLLFFFCYAYNVSTKSIINIFSIFTLVVFMIQIYDQFLGSPPFLFGGIENEYGGYIKRGFVYRISILINISTMVLFYYWDKLIKYEERYKSLLFVIIGLMLTYFTCTRQRILATLITITYISFANTKRNRFAILLIGVVFILLYQYGGVIFESLISLTQNQQEDNSFGGRNDSYAFYWNKILTEPATFLFGSGNAYGGVYEHTMRQWTTIKKYIIVDIGHIGQFFLYGISYLIVFFYSQYKLFIKYRKYLPNYLLCYFIYINIIGFMIAPLANLEYICIFALAMYLADREIQHNIYAAKHNLQIIK